MSGRRQGSGSAISLELARDILLGPVPQETAVETVVRRLRDAIELGVLAPGERLPAETDLARSMDIGVMTLRAALAALRDDGLLETRRGRTGGSFVRASPLGFPPAAVDLVAARAVLEVRAAVESGAAFHAARRATPQDVFTLEVLVDWMGDPARASKTWALDAQFHLAVAEISRNPRLVAVVLEQKAAGARVFAALDVEWGDAGRWNGDHRRIVEAIARREPETAASEMRRHIEDVLTFLEEAVGGGATPAGVVTGIAADDAAPFL